MIKYENVDNFIAVLSNELIESSINLNGFDRKLFLLLISLVNSTDKNISSPIKVKISKKDIIQILSLDDNDYKRIKNSLNKLEKCIAITRDKKKIKLISKIENPYRSNIINVEFHKDIEAHISKIEKNFTKLRMKNILNLDKKYSIRFYELMTRFKEKKFRTETIENLKEKLGIEKGKYEKFEAFERRVIKPSIKEINKKTNLNIYYEKKKSFGKITLIKFYF